MPGNKLIAFEDQMKLGVREDRYGLKGDNGYSDLVEKQKSEKSPEKDNILNFTNQKDPSPEKSINMDDYDLKPVKEEKRKIVN